MVRQKLTLAEVTSWHATDRFTQ